MCAYLRAEIEISSIILTSFRQGVILPSTPKQTPKKPTQIRINKMKREKFWKTSNLILMKT